ncbi:MAG TPA: hypothetical protein ENJ82_01625 [Bacteroidetes bacterium]|nr:hypothetical protein [Bacteroidota bacterium]
MEQFSIKNIAYWKLKCILNALNSFPNAPELSAAVQAAPGLEPGLPALEEALAQRIFDRKAAQQHGRFTAIGQLQNIDGLSQDKLQNLVYSFGISAAEQFKLSMYHDLLQDNWVLNYDRSEFPDERAFLNLVDNPTAFKSWLADKVAELAVQKTGQANNGPLAQKSLNNACVESFYSGYVGSYSMALWFFRFDEDNWFSFDRVHEKTEIYLSSPAYARDRIELRNFVGFENSGLLANPITVSGLPVTVNYMEQTISIWSCQLND